MYKEIGENEVVYRCIGDELDNGIVSCGFMRKRTADRSQYNFCIGYYSCFIILRGSGRYITESGTVIRMQPGVFVQRIPGCIHSTEIDPDGEWLEFYISVGYPIYEYLKTLGIIESAEPVKGINLKELPTYRLVNLLREIQRSTDSELPHMMLKAQDLIIWMHRSIHGQNFDEYDVLIDKACQRISSFSDIHQSMKEVAKELPMGYENFRKVFKRKTGQSPQRYYTDQIMKQARMMLISEVPVKEVARSLGYSDVYSFTKIFTKTVGTPPGSYTQPKK